MPNPLAATTSSLRIDAARRAPDAWRGSASKAICRRKIVPDGRRGKRGLTYGSTDLIKTQNDIACRIKPRNARAGMVVDQETAAVTCLCTQRASEVGVDISAKGRIACIDVETARSGRKTEPLIRYQKVGRWSF